MQAPESEGSATSFLRPIGYQSGSCGYCQDKHSSQRILNTRANYYAATDSLDPTHYQLLVDRGWRRSGTLLYKPDQWRSCCPHYTIRLPAAELKASRDQRQAVNRWNRYVIGEDYAKEAARLRPKSKEDKKREKNEGFNLLRTIHESEHGRLVEPPPLAHRFEVSLEPDDFTEEKFALYANYQEHVHHDPPNEITRSGFRRFLCNSPIHRRTRILDSASSGEASDGKDQARKEQKLGSYHQLYRLDGRLIALGVLDLLPHCVSGVYFLYHSDFEKWSFGKLSALREAAMAVEDGYQFYYMGYYIHECVKMRYKGDYKPQMVLDPESYEWVPLDGDFRDALDQRKFVSRDVAKTLAEQRKKRKRSDVEDEEHSSAANGSAIEEADRLNLGADHPRDEHDTREMKENDNGLYTMPNPEEAAETGLSLLELRMPGVMNTEELETQIDLDHMKIKIGKLQVNTEDIVSWDEGSVEDEQSIKGIVAELAACIGPELAGEVVLKFGR